MSIEEQPVAEKIAREDDINEKFIKMEKVQLQKSSPTKMLLKQSHVNSEDFKEETINDFVEIQVVESEAKVAVEETVNIKTLIPIVESFPKTVEIPQQQENFVPIHVHEQVQALPTQNDLVNPALEPTITVLKSPENLASKDFTTENVTEMPAEHVPTVEIIDETSNSDLKINVFTSSLPTDDASGAFQASAAMENVKYLSLHLIFSYFNFQHFFRIMQLEVQHQSTM